MSLSPSTQQVSTVLNLCPQNRIFIFAETALIFQYCCPTEDKLLYNSFLVY